MFFIMFTSSCASKNIHQPYQALQNNKEHQGKKTHSIQITHLVPMILVDRHISGGIVRDGPLFSRTQIQASLSPLRYPKESEEKGHGCSNCSAYLLTGYLYEGVPDAGAPAPVLGHPLDLVRRRGRPKDEALRERAAAQPAGVVDLRVEPVASRRRQRQQQQTMPPW